MSHSIPEPLEENWQVVSNLSKKWISEFQQKMENSKILDFCSSWKGKPVMNTFHEGNLILFTIYVSS